VAFYQVSPRRASYLWRTAPLVALLWIFRGFAVALSPACVALGIDQMVDVHDEIAHVRIVDAAVRRLRAWQASALVGVDADGIARVHAGKGDAGELRELAAEDEVEKLPGASDAASGRAGWGSCPGDLRASVGQKEDPGPRANHAFTLPLKRL
jgi:hypothetical protein